MKKDELQIGYLVVFRNGDKSIILPNMNNSLVAVVEDTGFMPLVEYDDDLYCTPTDDPEVAEFDIMKVYGRSTSSGYLNSYTIDNRSLLWKREELNVIYSSYGTFAVSQKGLELAISKIKSLQIEVDAEKESNTILKNKLGGAS